MKILKVVLSDNIVIVDTDGNVHMVQEGSSTYNEGFEDLMDSFENCTNYSQSAPENGMDTMIAYDDRDGNGHTVAAHPCYYTGVWEMNEACYSMW